MKSGKRRTEMEVNDENFQENVLVQSKKIPILVDFWAAWCTPCLMLSPILEKLAKEYDWKNLFQQKVMLMKTE